MKKTARAKYYNSTFEKIPEQKRLKVLKIAARELASAGLTGARMKDIATRAEVSYGSLYNYFPTRDDMIRTIIQEGRSLQEAIFADVRTNAGSFFVNLEQVLIRVQKLAREHPALIAIWVEVSHSYNERFVDDVMDLEVDGITFWKQMLTAGINAGEISPQTDVSGAAFLIDNAVSCLLKAGISAVQGKRLKLFFEDGPTPKRKLADERVRDSLLKTFRALLQK